MTVPIEFAQRTLVLLKRILSEVAVQFDNTDDQIKRAELMMQWRSLVNDIVDIAIEADETFHNTSNPDGNHTIN